MSDTPPDDPKPAGTITVDPKPGFDLIFDGMEATETLGRPFLITVDVSATQSTSALLKTLGSSVTVTLAGTDSSTPRYFNGILTRMIYAGLAGGAARYQLELRPWLWLLSHTKDCKIFQNQSPFDIIQAVISANGFSSFVADKRQNQAGSTVLEYCVQYRETSLDFITRLMEQYGIYFYFTHDNGKHTLNFCDDPNCHTALADSIPYQRDMTEVRAVADHIWEFAADLRFEAGAYTACDYNFTTPSADLTAKSLKPGTYKHGSLEVYDYPGLYDAAANGTKLTDIRIQELAAKRQVFAGTTNARGLVCGCKFTLKDADKVDPALNAEYIVIGTSSHFGMGESKSSGSDGVLTDSHVTHFQAIPGTTPFQLERHTPVPMIRGPQTALVVGNAGDEITVDQYGRVKVHFYWDRVNPKDQTASCWIRVAQSWAGVGWGSMFIPRIGMEVVVEFLEGNPDRPLITGCVYNASQTVPYPLPDNATRSTIKTNSSKGGGGYNELRFEDKKGEEEVYFQAQYDYNKKVLHNETATITQDMTHTVSQGNRSITVSQGNNSLTVSQGNNSLTVSQGNHSLTVSTGNSSATVKGNDSLTVSSGNHSITVSAGTSTIEAAQSITLKVGGNSITIDTTGVSISATKVDIQAQAQLSAQGGQVSVNAQSTMSLQATAALSVQGLPVSIN